MVRLWLVASILYPAVEALATELAIRCSRMDGVAQVADPLPQHLGIMAADVLHFYVGIGHKFIQ
jgi:hypothetical protein